ncbi:putative sugar O-methyltransferase [Polaromonas sp.]|jgi:putative sugar O-methyltransferase|uniref:putative sugar O-methyltransferase n=1 Tax=Polaromonas sp. TaxID=1869339 RepID=UPI0037C9719A
MNTGSKLWEQYTQNEFSSISEDFLTRFRAPGVANKFVAWDPYEQSTRYMKFLLLAIARQQPPEFFDIYSRIGNTDFGLPLHIQHRNLLLNADYMAAVEEWLFIKRHTHPARLRKVVEVGAGFGRTCHTLLTLCDSIESYVIVDLAPMLELSRQYLAKVVPERMSRISFVSSEDRTGQSRLDADLVLNIDSFQEMPPLVIDGYMERIVQNSKYFFCKNPVGKYLPQTVGFPELSPNQLQDVFSLGYCTDVLDIFDEDALAPARDKLVELYCPPAVPMRSAFESTGDEPMSLFPYFHLVMYENKALP